MVGLPPVDPERARRFSTNYTHMLVKFSHRRLCVPPPPPLSLRRTPLRLAVIRYEAGISNALKMQPSAPALGIPPDSKGGKAAAVVPQYRADHADTLSACAIATRPGHLLTRLSLHGQGVRTIEGLEACHNLKVLVSLLLKPEVDVGRFGVD